MMAVTGLVIWRGGEGIFQKIMLSFCLKVNVIPWFQNILIGLRGQNYSWPTYSMITIKLFLFFNKPINWNYLPGDPTQTSLLVTEMKAQDTHLNWLKMSKERQKFLSERYRQSVVWLFKTGSNIVDISGVSILNKLFYCTLVNKEFFWFM